MSPRTRTLITHAGMLVSAVCVGVEMFADPRFQPAAAVCVGTTLAAAHDGLARLWATR